MAQLRLPALAFLCVAALLLASGPALAVDDLSVKMWYPDQVKPGETTNVSLEVRNENYDFLVNITWAPTASSRFCGDGSRSRSGSNRPSRCPS
jgi:hypothetical protein